MAMQKTAADETAPAETIALSPRSAVEAFAALRSEIGFKAEIYVALSVKGLTDKALRASVYPFGICDNRESLIVYADDFDTLLVAAADAWTEHRLVHEQRVVRAMALRIIQITAEHGECTDAALRGSEFACDQVKRFGARAVEDANAMAANGPFAIKSAATSNGAPEAEAA